MWYAAYRGRESEHQVLNGSLIFVSFTRTPILFGSKFQYSGKRRQDEEGKQSNKAAIRDLVLTFCPTVRRIQQRKLKLLMPVYTRGILGCLLGFWPLGQNPAEANTIFLMNFKGICVTCFCYISTQPSFW